MKLLGQDVIFSLAGETVAFATSCEIGTDTDFIEVCSPVSGADTEYLPTTFGWSLSGNYLCANLADKARLIELQRAKKKFKVRIFDRELSTVLEGYCYIKSLRLSASVGSLAKFAATYQPTGGLVPVEARSIFDRDGKTINYHIEGDAVNHRFVGGKEGGFGMYVIPVHVTSLSRLHVDYDDNEGRPLIVAKVSIKNPDESNMEDAISETIEQGTMLHFYADNEVAHVEDNKHADILLKPGDYFILHNKADEEHEHSLLESLPVTN